MSVKYILNAWKSYEAEVISPLAGPHQRHDMRAAFYAGALTVMSTILAKIPEDADGHEPTDDEMGVIEDIVTELDEFMADQKREVLRSTKNAN